MGVFSSCPSLSQPPARAFKPFGLADAPSLRSGSGSPVACPIRRMNNTPKAQAGQAPYSGTAHIPTLPVSARWAHDHDPRPHSDPGTTRGTTRPVVGERTTLGSYVVAGERRVIIGQRVDGVVRISDCPDGTAGRAYLIERGLETKAELDAVVVDYLKRATELQAVPMSVMPVESPA